LRRLSSFVLRIGQDRHTGKSPAGQHAGSRRVTPAPGENWLLRNRFLDVIVMFQPLRFAQQPFITPGMRSDQARYGHFGMAIGLELFADVG
jgi:hypothetical protein